MLVTQLVKIYTAHKWFGHKNIRNTLVSLVINPGACYSYFYLLPECYAKLGLIMTTIM